MQGAGTRAVMDIIERRHLVAQRYLQGEQQFEIAASLGLDRSVISRDLKAMRELWLKQIVEHYDAAKARELAKIAMVEQEAWRSWHRSQEPREITVTEQSEGGEVAGPDGTLVPRSPTRKASIRREGQTGHPAYLTVIQKCIDQRVDILGLKAPTHIRLDLESLTTEQLWLLASGTPPEQVQQGQAPMAQAWRL